MFAMWELSLLSLRGAGVALAATACLPGSNTADSRMLNVGQLGTAQPAELYKDHVGLYGTSGALLNLSQYLGNALNTSMLTDAGVADGRLANAVFALPSHDVGQAVITNGQLLDQRGIDYNQVKSWDDLAALAREPQLPGAAPDWWFFPPILLSVAANTRNPQLSVALCDFFVNSVPAGKITQGGERLHVGGERSDRH